MKFWTRCYSVQQNPQACNKFTRMGESVITEFEETLFKIKISGSMSRTGSFSGSLIGSLDTQLFSAVFILGT